MLRIEDTDPARFSEEAFTAVLQDLKWLSLEWDEGPEVGGPHGPYRQSERSHLYAGAVSRLLESGSAYRCFCTAEELVRRRAEARAQGRPPGYDGRCRNLTAEQIRRYEEEGRPAAVRFRLPDQDAVVFEDLVIGEVSTNVDRLDDFAIARSDGAALYNLAVVVDDGMMQISHVIRGDDLLSNTPKQILLHGALGNPIPRFAHLPQVLGPDRKPLSKRHGSTSISEFRQAGYLPEALVNFLALLGWGTAGDTILSVDELTNKFDIEDVHPSPAMFDPAKLDWMNGEYIRQLPEKELTRRLEPFYARTGLISVPPSPEERRKIDAATPLVQTRMRHLAEAPNLVRGLFTEVEMDPAAVDKVMREPHVPELLKRAADALDNLAAWSDEGVEAVLRSVAEELGVKPRKAFGPVYVAISGSTVSAPVFDLIALLGREESVGRLRKAEALSNRLGAGAAADQKG